MKLEIKAKIPDKIAKTSVLQQTKFWSKVKKKQGLKPKAIDIKIKNGDIKYSNRSNRYINDDLLILVKDIGDGLKLGYMYHRMGCWDYPPNIRQYELFKAAEMTSQGFHLR